ncbi:MAG: hypothetical protein GYA24_06300, partial [Candidatus Lokiarchaeota archaeon]|nr:hypothetical protein [Candidatus Lokiarchaeota archaeon]
MQQRSKTRLERVSFAMNVGSFTFLAMAAGYILIASTATWCAVQGRWETVFATWVAIFGLVTTVMAFAVRFHDNIPARVAMIAIELALGAVVLVYYLMQEKSWCIDQPAWNQVAGIAGIAMGLVAIVLNFIAMGIDRPPHAKVTRREWIALLVPVIALGIVISGASTSWFDPHYHVMVPARDDAPPMRFSFWSRLNNDTNGSYYNASQWQQLDNHGAIITAYSTSSTSNDTFGWARYLRDTYPRIRLMWPLFGGYYNGEQIEADTTRYLNAIQAFGLTNTLGFVFDLERLNDTCWHDVAKWQEFQASMSRCASAIKAQNASYRIDNTAGIWMLFSHYPLGGGARTEILFQHALMSLSSTMGWNGYQWQLYRGNAVSPASDPDSTNMYERIFTSVRGVGASKTVPLFGMTGVGDYGPNNCSVDGVPCNFAGVIKDCRLARSLGITEVGFYTLCDAVTWEGVYYPSMFEAYGGNFLDVLNASVNGLDEPMVIDLPGNTAFRTTAGYYWEFAGYSIDGATVGI